MYDPSYKFNAPARSAHDLSAVRLSKGLEKPIDPDNVVVEDGNMIRGIYEGLKDTLLPNWTRGLGNYLYDIFMGHTDASLALTINDLKKKGYSDSEIMREISNRLNHTRKKYIFKGKAALANNLTRYGGEVLKNIMTSIIMQTVLGSLGNRTLKLAKFLPPDVDMKNAIFKTNNNQYLTGAELASGKPEMNKWALAFMDFLLPPSISTALRLGMHPRELQYVGAHDDPAAAMSMLDNPLINNSAIEGLNLANGTQPVIKFPMKNENWGWGSYFSNLFKKSNSTDIPGGRVRRHRKRKTSSKKRSKCHRK